MIHNILQGLFIGLTIGLTVDTGLVPTILISVGVVTFLTILEYSIFK